MLPGPRIPAVATNSASYADGAVRTSRRDRLGQFSAMAMMARVHRPRPRAGGAESLVQLQARGAAADQAEREVTEKGLDTYADRCQGAELAHRPPQSPEPGEPEACGLNAALQGSPHGPAPEALLPDAAPSVVDVAAECLCGRVSGGFEFVDEVLRDVQRQESQLLQLRPRHRDDRPTGGRNPAPGQM